jgi:hypothetical protein
MRRTTIVAVFFVLMLVLAPATAGFGGKSAEVAAPRADLLQSTGKLTFLRVHDVGSGYGPGTDFIDVEVVTQLDSQPGKSFGFQVRNDAQRAARQGMLDLLRDAFNNNWTVTLDYDIEPGKNNGVIIRVALRKP